MCICGDVYSLDGTHTRLDLIVKGERSKVQINCDYIFIKSMEVRNSMDKEHGGYLG